MCMYPLFFYFQIMNLDTEGAEIQVKYMKKKGTFYRFPDKEDSSWEPLCNIMRKMEPPQLANSRMQFTFND